MMAIAPNPHGLAMRRRAAARAGFSMTEMLIVMGIMTVLAASLIILVPGIRTRAMRAQAGADIHLMSMAISQFREDTGSYPDRPYAPGTPTAPGVYDYIDRCLFECLTNRDFDFLNPATPKANAGWGGAKTTWEFLRGDSKALRQILDPWAVPYYYIPCTSYLLGVRVNDPTDSTPLVHDSKALPNCFGTSPPWDDFRTGDPNYPPDGYITPQQLLGKFYNSTTFQIHSKGPDQRTDYYSDNCTEAERAAQQAIIDACDRGQDPDDKHNFEGGNDD